MEFIEQIQKQFGKLKPLTLNEISETLEQVSFIPQHLIEPYITDPDQFAYGRNILYRNDNIEVILINIPPNKETAIHDHGNSIGCAMVLEGEMVNSIYRATENYAEKTSSYTVGKRDCIYSTAGLIHKMSNSHNERMVSIHVYSPPLQGMTSFNEREERVISFDSP
jgi:cysteine dioxygenase